MAAPLSSWIARRDPDRQSAHHKLDRMPLAPTTHGKTVPFPFADKEAYKADFSNREINGAIESAPKKTVPLEGLHAIQHSVKGNRVGEYIDYPTDALIPPGTRATTHKGLIDTPIVVQYKGKRYIHDGHHRLTARKLAGERDAEVRFVDLDSVAKV